MILSDMGKDKWDFKLSKNKSNKHSNTEYRIRTSCTQQNMMDIRWL